MHQRTTTALVVGGCVPGLGHVLLLSLLVATYGLADGEAAAASRAPARSPAVLTGGSVDGQNHAVSVVARAAVDRCAGVARNAGYRTRSRLVTAVAIGMAESTCRASARHRNGPTRGCRDGLTDRGMWQINDCYHADVSNDCP